jgi:ribosomal 50S subunit-recycling heat shock protein
MFMRRTGFALLAGLLFLSIAAGGCATAPAGKSAGTAEPPSWQTSSVVEETATVEAVNQSTRMVTLKGPKGNSVTFKASDEVRNLAQVKVGDEVKFAYYESLAVRVLKEGEAFPAAGESAAMVRAKPGEKPAGVVGTETSVNATITAIDMAAKTATLKGEDGKSVTVTPRDPKNLEKVKVGDRLVITYTEAVAVSVEKAEKKK